MQDYDFGDGEATKHEDFKNTLLDYFEFYDTHV